MFPPEVRETEDPNLSRERITLLAAYTAPEQRHDHAIPTKRIYCYGARSVKYAAAGGCYVESQQWEKRAPASRYKQTHHCIRLRPSQNVIYQVPRFP